MDEQILEECRALLAGGECPAGRIVKCFEGRIIRRDAKSLTAEFDTRYMEHAAYGDLYGNCRLEAQFSVTGEGLALRSICCV